MSKTVTAAMVAGLTIGMAPAANADDAITLEVCRAVMALGVDPYDPSDRYTLNMLERYPNMTYNQANALVTQAYQSVMYHENPMCNDVTIPANY